MNQINIEMSDYACKKYIERFSPDLASVRDVNERLRRAKIGIKSVLQSAHYVSDNEEGILLHSPLHKCNIIVRNRKLITLYKPEKKKLNPRPEKWVNH